MTITYISIPKSVKMGRELAQKRGSTHQERAAFADQLVKDGQEMAKRIFENCKVVPEKHWIKKKKGLGVIYTHPDLEYAVVDRKYSVFGDRITYKNIPFNTVEEAQEYALNETRDN